MITYVYECWNCGYRFEARQSIKDEPFEDCPECGGLVHRLISGGLGTAVDSYDPDTSCSAGGF